MGAIIDPWGTPRDRHSSVELDVVPDETNCFRLERKDLISDAAGSEKL